jgi:hypothetical protein
LAASAMAIVIQCGFMGLWYGGLNAVPVSWDALMKPWDCERRVWEAAENC